MIIRAIRGFDDRFSNPVFFAPDFFIFKKFSLSKTRKLWNVGHTFEVRSDIQIKKLGDTQWKKDFLHQSP